MTRNALSITCTALVLANSLALPAYAGVTRYSWKPVPHADYYEGTVRSGTETRRFRTQGEWLLFPDDAKVEMQAYDHLGQPIRAVPLSSTSVAKPAPAETASDGEQPFYAKELEGEDDETPEKPAAAAAEVPAATKPRSTEPVDPSVKNLDLLALSLGAGKEDIEAKAGVTAFKGDAGVGGTVLSGQQQQKGSAWYFQGLLSAHNFATELREASGATGVNVHETKFLRLHGRAGALYDFFYKHDKRLIAAGAGVLYLRLPGLDVADPTTKEAELVNVSSIGPYAVLAYQEAFSEAQSLGLELMYEPMVLSPETEGTALAVQLAWRYAFAPPIYMELGMVHRQEAVEVEIDCGAVADCSESSETNSAVSQGLIGFGYKF